MRAPERVLNRFRRATFFMLCIALIVPKVSFAMGGDSRTLTFSQTTVDRGYSMLSPDGNARIIFRPHALTVPTTVTILHNDLSVAEPQNYVLYGEGMLSVTFSPSLPKEFTRPIILSATTEEPSTTVIGVLTDAQATAWTLLDTHSAGPATVQATVAQPFVAFAIFSQTTYPLESLGIQSKAAAVYDEVSGTFVGTFNGDTVHSIASMTKLITASVFLDAKPNMNKILTYTKADERAGARLALRYGETIRRRDAFAAMLLGSANNATALIARSTGFSKEEFVRRMNAKAQALGLSNTHFVEPTGLDPRNVSTADEYAILASSILRSTALQKVMAQTSMTFRTINKKKQHTIKNTDTLLTANISATAGKTGYLEEAGYTMALQTKPDTTHSYLTVVLGNRTSSSRYNDAKTVAQFAAAQAANPG